MIIEIPDGRINPEELNKEEREKFDKISSAILNQFPTKDKFLESLEEEE